GRAAAAHATVASAPSSQPAAENTPLHLTDVTAHGHASSGDGSTIMRTILGLVLVIGVIYGVAWILRQVRKGRDGRASGTGLAPIASMPLGAGRSVQLVRAGQEYLLLGVAEQGVTMLRSYSEAEALAAGFELPREQPVWNDPAERDRPGAINTLRRFTVRS
ncbi:MAG TPA: flagellar biosynthetic protein FliO, partial [Solirubrobacteraceae bacterium]|nr:flagellar biosynthetic protein FliO [Solirubrobacteraceae bacterium]